MRINNRSGSILIITLTFVLIFILLGIASIHYVGAHNEFTSKQVMSNKAFWIADGAIEFAKTKLPQLFDKNNSSNQNIAWKGGTYDIASEKKQECKNDPTADPATCCPGTQCYTYSFTWTVDSKGVFNNEKRKIHAELSANGIEDVVNAKGPIKDYDKCPMASIDIFDENNAPDTECELVEEEVVFNFSSIFGGITFNTAKLNADNTYTDPTGLSDSDIVGLTVINIDDAKQLQIPNNKIDGSGFILIDATLANNKGEVPAVKFEGGDFYGIVWILGQAEVRFSGSPTFNGSIFIDGPTTFQTPITGTGDYYFDPIAIDLAAKELCNNIPSCVVPGDPDFISWKELPI